MILFENIHRNYITSYNITVIYINFCSFQNAEMAFNFGDKPLKHSLPQGYQPIISAPPDKVIKNNNGHGGSKAAATQIINNAPQAIIIEVSRRANHKVFNV